MRTETAPTILRTDYQPYPYRLPQVALEFDLGAELTRVRSRLRVELAANDLQPLILDGEDLELESIHIDGKPLSSSQWQLSDTTLTLFPEKKSFLLEIVNLCRPADNTALMGLYVSGKSLFTQCEAEGFRRITWFPDRPDVMARYTVTLRAPQQPYPYLLSNGNLLQTRVLNDGRHEAVWEDPHPKPSYLFALVAGDFDLREQTIQTGSGRQALLQVYSDKGTQQQTAWAMTCLERAIRWDESRFGLPLDLDRFMIVAARDFNMGAMENKGLNIFNSTYVLADPDTATDATYQAIESIIGHEYFHNWTGNRVTCRDWFQLSLKEGLTVFRDQEFSADMLASGLDPEAARTARAIKRIDDVSTLRVAQFPEDAGPMAHPIRPESYQEISNFYTATIYEKGAEVIRMLHTLMGPEAFGAGLAEYFRRHDGQAVTCDDFIDALDSAWRKRAPGKNLDTFRRWYSQAGTPQVAVKLHYNADTRRCTLALEQHCAPAGLEVQQQPPASKPPLHIPFAIGLLDAEGRSLQLQQGTQSDITLILELASKKQSFTFENIPSAPVASLLRNFSAPVIVNYQRPDHEWALLARHDPDGFARWEASQELALRQLQAQVAAIQSTTPHPLNPELVAVWRDLLEDSSIGPAYRARLLALPPEKIVLERTTPYDPLAVNQARRQVQAGLGKALTSLWLASYRAAHTASSGTFSADALPAGYRALKALALRYLMAAQHPEARPLALTQYYEANNMTDRVNALWALVDQGEDEAAQTDAALRHFYEQWQHSPQVVDRWFSLQAQAPANGPEAIRGLMLHPAFTLRNPNRARALVFQFCQNNPKGIHQAEGYAFWAEQVLALDQLNPEIAARLARLFDNWKRYAAPYRDSIRQALERIHTHPGLSRNVAEITKKALDH